MNDTVNQGYVNITHILREAARTLSDENPLICDETSFRLREAMQALEVMHPLMDKCDVPTSVYSRPFELMWRQDTERIKDFTNDIKIPPRKPPSGLDDEISPLPWTSLSFRSARIITLEHIIRLESFLSGSDVLESIYTSLYAHDAVLRDMMERVERDTQITEPMAAQWVVFASTLLLVKLSEMIQTIILHADIYEEEDFSYFSGGSNHTFFPMITSEEEIRNVVSHAVNLLSGQNFEDNNDAWVIHRCLLFQLCLYISCAWMSQLTSTTVRIKVEAIRVILEECAHHLHSIISHFNVEGVDLSDEDTLVLFQSFDVHMNRPLLSNHPVRKVEYKNVIKALEKLHSVVTDTNHWVCAPILQASTLNQIHHKLLDFSSSPSPINILGRSLMVYNLFFDGLIFGQYDIAPLIVGHLQACGVSVNLIKGQETFVEMLHKPIYNIFKLLTLNRNRQRIFIESCIIPDWVILQREAAAIDFVCSKEDTLETHKVPVFFNYILAFITWIMEHYVAISIELGLVSQHQEILSAVWYLEYLISCGISVHTQMRKCHVSTDEPSEGHGNKMWSSNFIDHLKLKQMLCRGQIRLLLALNRCNLLKPSSFTFTNHAVIFGKRYDVFHEIRHPTLLTYHDFINFTDGKEIGAIEHLNYAITCFKLSKTIIEKLQSQQLSGGDIYLSREQSEFMKLVSVCMTNIDTAESLLASEKKSSIREMKVSFDFQAHKQFFSIKLTPYEDNV